MIWYVLVFIFCLLMYIFHSKSKTEKQKKIIEVMTLIILILFSGTRYRLGGYDYSIYEKIFYDVVKLKDFNFSINN